MATRLACLVQRGKKKSDLEVAFLFIRQEFLL